MAETVGLEPTNAFQALCFLNSPATITGLRLQALTLKNSGQLKCTLLPAVAASTSGSG
jgi:hypothetical protein